MKRSPVYIISVLVLFIFTFQTAAMPPLRPGSEPSYPEGVNSSNLSLLMRDDADIEGEWNCLVILIDFEDYPWDKTDDDNFPNDDGYYTTDHFNDMLFSVDEFAHPGSESEYTGSMRDYYREVSSELFETIGIATRWYRAPEPLSYYCNNDGEPDTDDDNGFGEYPNNVQKLVEDAIQLADDDVDFSEYDNNDDGTVDALFVVHAGPGAEEIGRGEEGDGYIWSHKWQIFGSFADNVEITTYSMEPENGTIGVYCHEFGHVLGLPDLYDTDDSSEGVGEWCLMGGGGWGHRPGDPHGTCPSHFCGWAKSKFEWVEVINIQANAENTVIPPVEYEPLVYRLWRRGEASREYFLVEHRARIGFDAGLTRRQIEFNLDAPQGLLISHVDDNLWENSDDEHRLVDIEEASVVWIDHEPFEQLDGARIWGNDDNLYNSNRGDNGDLWPGYSETTEDSTDWTGQRDRNTFSALSTPSSASYSGEPSLVSIGNIRLDEENIVCDLNVDPGQEPYLYVTSYMVDDGVGGNGDGFIDPGETICLFLTIGNIGREDAEGFYGRLEYEGDLAEVTGDSVEIPDIASNEELELMDFLSVRISENAPSVCRITLDFIAGNVDNIECVSQLILEVRPEREWFKHKWNPVLPGIPDHWDLGVASPAILIEDDTLKCWYVGLDNPDILGGNIGFAWSLDGGYTWDRAENPVLTPGDNIEWLDVFQGIDIMSVENGYLMAFYTEDENGNTFIGLADSEDGITWSVREDPIIQGGDAWTTSLYAMGQLAFLDYQDQTGLVFSGGNQMGLAALGLALSSDLENWEINNEFVIDPTLEQEDFDAASLLSPDVYQDGELYHVYYTGVDFQYNLRLGLITTDGNQLSRYPGTETGGSVLEAGGTGSWGESFILGGRYFEWDGEKRLLYTGLSESSADIGLATDNPVQFIIPKDEKRGVPETISLDSAYPNPFNSTVTISFNLKKPGNVNTSIFDLSGRRISDLSNARLSSGRHFINWNAGNLPSGTYIARVSTESNSSEMRLVLVK